MQALRRSWFLRSVVIPLTLLTWFSGCMKWSTQRMPVDELVSEKEPKKVRVTQANDYVVDLKSPRIDGDSLIGFSENDTRIAIALADVKRIQIRTVNPVATTLLVAGLGITLLAVIDAATTQPKPPMRPRGGEPVVLSCPLVYSWDGERWRLDSGTFGGAIFRTLSRTDVDNLDFARAEEGQLRLRLANELAETDHVDALSVLAVDHAPGVTVAPDGHGVLHSLGSLTLPLSARDDRGRDALDRVVSADGWNWESSPSVRDTAVSADLRDGLEVAFFRPPGARGARLVIDANNTSWAAYLMQEYVRLHGSATGAWYDSMNVDPIRARQAGQKLAQEAFLRVLVETEEGWEPQGLLWEAGPEVVKRQVLALDLSRARGDTVWVRLESVPSFWLVDQVAIDYASERPFTVREVLPQTAVDQAGHDVRPLLVANDGDEFVMERGDFADLTFRVPEVPEGRARSYVLRSTGWYRVRTAEVGEPDVHTLARIEKEAGAIARFSVAKMNEALAVLAQGRVQ